MTDLLTTLRTASPERRHRILSGFSQEERARIAALLDERAANPYLRWAEDPVGFVTRGLGETVWSKQVEIMESVLNYPRTAVPACHAPGKALTIDTRLRTQNGWTTMGAVGAGDHVIAPDGSWTRVVATGPVHDQPTYRVHFSDGSHVDAAGPHEWRVRTRSGYRTLRTDQMLDPWRSNGATRAARYAVDVTAPVQGISIDLTVDPYLLGYWLGDGDSARGYITVHAADAEPLTAQLTDRWHVVGSAAATALRLSLPGLSARLRSLGVLGAKRIPDRYLVASVGDRRRLLAGLMDSDGWAQQTEACFVSTSETLARGVLELVRSLGEKPTIREGVARLNGRAVSKQWRVSFCPAESPFTLPRKTAAMAPLRTTKSSRRSVVAVVPLGVLPVRCIEVAHPSHLYLAGDAMIPTHNSHIAARIIAWWGSVHPAGTARILTTATTYRQVKNVLWPYIRRVHSLHGLPGTMNLLEWKIGGEILAEGVKPPDEDETAMSGLHAPHVLIVVDEAGGISHAFGGTLSGLTTGSHTRLLLIGNPAADDEGTWFEKQCEQTDLYNVIPIPVSATPNWTGEDAGRCMNHPEMEPHPVTDHLVDRQWALDIVRQYGEGSAYVLARRDAIFPKSNESKVMPQQWLQAANLRAPLSPDAVDDRAERIRHGEIRLGIDIATGGPDEFVIAKLDGNHVTLVHSTVGKQNAQPGYVEGVVMRAAREAAAEHAARRISTPVRVKIDSVGPGWGIFQAVKAKEKTIPAPGVVFLEVEAGNSARDSDHYNMVRSEMWWGARGAIEPDTAGDQQIVLDVPEDAIAQLNAPKWTTDSRGRIVVERKDEMARRGIKSPDRADAIIQAIYEPTGYAPPPAVGPIIVGVGEVPLPRGYTKSFG